MINLYAKRKFTLPIFAECITPDNFQGKTIEEIETLKVWEGNKEKKLAEIFKVERIKKEEENEPIITIYGDLRKIRMIGAKMTKGQIIIHGDVGMYLGQEMEDGKITVRGNADRWAGSMMKGGTIEIYGNAGSYLAAPYRGSTAGMRGGKIIVGGTIESVLPTFTIEGLKKKVKVEEGEVVEGPFYLFSGDITENGEGKLYISKMKNPHLSFYEKLI